MLFGPACSSPAAHEVGTYAHVARAEEAHIHVRSCEYQEGAAVWKAECRCFSLHFDRPAVSPRIYLIFPLKQEDLIQSADPESVQVSTKDMDSTLSRASRAIKKTSKKVELLRMTRHAFTSHYR